MTYSPKPDSTDAERIASMETVLYDMHSRLFGNGQPGEIEKLKDRISSMERWMWRCVGGAAVVIFALERMKP